MKKYLLVIVGLVFLLISITMAQEFETLNHVKIPILSETYINVNTLYKEEATIYSFIENPDYIHGLTISGRVMLNHDTSIVRLILIDRSNNEYLIYEANQFDQIKEMIDINSACEETSLLDSIFPKSIMLIIQDAEIFLSTIKTFKTSKDIRENYKSYKDLMTQNYQQEKLLKVKQYIVNKNMIWSARQTPVSILSYFEKKNLFGKYFNTFGFEYYHDGFFEFITGDEGYIGGSHLTEDTTNFIKKFDWRERHGANIQNSPYYGGSDGWITPNKCQSGCWLNGVLRCDIGSEFSIKPCIVFGGVWRSVGTCWAFGPVASTEALVNLYYNQQLDLDLSEQEVVSCTHGVAEAWYQSDALDYIRDDGVVDENCYPYLAADGNCNNVCNNPDEEISIHSYQYPGWMPSVSTIKKYLIEQGPMSATHGDWRHAFLLVGFDTVALGDYIDYLDGDVIDESDSAYLGKTFWIFKQSNTYTGYPYHTGYVYMLNKPRQIYPIFTPIASMNYDSTDIKCYDKDNDGYYWWGIGKKPSTCPTCSSDEPDGDDYNANMGPLDTNGYCIEITEPFCFDSIEVTSNTTWSVNTTICGDVIVKNGATLTVTSNIFLGESVEIMVRESSILIVDGGTMTNAKIKVSSGEMRFINYGTLKANSSDDIIICEGAQLYIPYGQIQLIE